MQRSFMGFKNNPKLHYYIEQAKITLRHMMIGFLAITALGLGFIIMVAGILALPIIKWWALRNIDKEVEVVKKGDFIEVEYEIVDDKEEAKDKPKDKK
jgi:hypothetical protein